jgi:hypothetical protein
MVLVILLKSRGGRSPSWDWSKHPVRNSLAEKKPGFSKKPGFWPTSNV